MFNRIGIVIAAALVGAAPLTALALTADQIIARNIVARGGLEQLKSLTSVHRIGHLVIPGANVDIATQRFVQRGGMARDEFTMQGLTQVYAYDGVQAWKIDPFEGRKDPANMSADEAKPFAIEGDLDLPLTDYAAKGYRVEYLGLEDVDGTPAYKLRLHLKTGDEVLYYIDPDSSMVIRDVQKQMVRGSEQETETDYGEFEKIGGVYFPMTEQSGPKGSESAQKQQIVFDKAVANEATPNALYSFPKE